MEQTFEAVVAGVLRRPLSEFTDARSDAARRLRKAGNTELATRVASLRKPSLPVWALDQAAAVAADDLAAVRTAGQQLRDAQLQLLGGDRSAAQRMSDAVQQQRRSVDTLTRRLGMVLTANGHAATDVTLRRIAESLRSASVAGDDTWVALAEGRLLAEPEADSFPALDPGAMRAVSNEAEEHEAEARRRRVAAAEEALRNAQSVERAAIEAEASARHHREEAAAAVAAAQRALDQLQER